MQENIEKVLKEIIEKLKRKYKPIKVILFGSYAHGSPRDDSDIDLLILKKTNERSIERFVKVKKIIYNPERKIPISPLIYSPTELNKRLEMGDDFIKEILKKGRILYEEPIS